MFIDFQGTLYNAASIKTVSWGERHSDDDEETVNGYYIYMEFLDGKGLRWTYWLEDKENFESKVSELRNKLLGKT